jgi:hypothetical protein
LSQDVVETNPTAGLKAYDPGTPRDRVLTVEEIESLWNWLGSGTLSSDAADILSETSNPNCNPHFEGD